MMALRSCSGVVMGMMLNFSTSTLRMPGVMKAGRLGPMRMSRMPRYSSDSNMATAFCSYHDSTSDNGSSLTDTPKASASVEFLNQYVEDAWRDEGWQAWSDADVLYA